MRHIIMTCCQCVPFTDALAWAFAFMSTPSHRHPSSLPTVMKSSPSFFLVISLGAGKGEKSEE